MADECVEMQVVSSSPSFDVSSLLVFFVYPPSIDPSSILQTKRLAQQFILDEHKNTRKQTGKEGKEKEKHIKQ